MSEKLEKLVEMLDELTLLEAADLSKMSRTSGVSQRRPLWRWPGCQWLPELRRLWRKRKRPNLTCS